MEIGSFQDDPLTWKSLQGEKGENIWSNTARRTNSAKLSSHQLSSMAGSVGHYIEQSSRRNKRPRRKCLDGGQTGKDSIIIENFSNDAMVKRITTHVTQKRISWYRHAMIRDYHTTETSRKAQAEVDGYTAKKI